MNSKNSNNAQTARKLTEKPSERVLAKNRAARVIEHAVKQAFQALALATVQPLRAKPMKKALPFYGQDTKVKDGTR